MFKFISGVCIVLAFAGSAQALDSAAPVALAVESVPPSSLSRQTALQPDTTVPVLPLTKYNTPKYRPVIVVQLQPADLIVDQAAENMAALQYDGDWESRRHDRMARFKELVRNAATTKPAIQTEPQRVLIETAPNINVFASNHGYGLGYGWPMHF